MIPQKGAQALRLRRRCVERIPMIPQSGAQALRLRSNAIEGLFDVGEDVVNVFNADRHSDDIGLYAAVL